VDEYESELEPLAEQTHDLETIVAIRPSSSGTVGSVPTGRPRTSAGLAAARSRGRRDGRPSVLGGQERR
jgi:hypothetical protein